jgi:acyl-CoA reductase-like NAD-dependent aldehyde dehydrogenase
MDHLAALMRAEPPPLAERRAVLERFAAALERRAEEMAQLIMRATRKPISASRGEVARGIGTIRGTAAACARLEPERVELGGAASAMITRVPLGPVLAVTPFNFPLNLALHKLCPAFAAGCATLWKPSPQAPGVAELARALLIEAGCPEAMLVLAPLSNDEVAATCADPRLAVLSFTGSVPVGRKLQALAARAKVILELGGNAAAILHRPREVNAAARSVANAATGHAGQVCISVQRIFYPAERREWRDALVEAFRAVPTGDPARNETVCGPVISPEAKTRIEGVLEGYRAAGGHALCGGEWNGLTLAPTLVEGVPAAHPLVRDTEIFAPIATLHPCRDLDEMLALADDTPFGLQAGLFSDDEAAIGRALARLRVGTLVVNDAPNRRDDRLPYGGTRDSGVGREGTFDAIMDYSEPRVAYRPNG